MSVPAYTADVERASVLKVSALDRNGSPIEIEAWPDFWPSPSSTR
ncbi:MAG: hypothetical protein HS130_05225 [Deltaproteobacteria bacterium]|nr:hypothetical protein [Deltaproteobacteria bacterium]